MGKDNKKPRLTDYQTFWKLILLVTVAVVAEGALLLASVSDNTIEWVARSEVSNPHRDLAQETAE